MKACAVSEVEMDDIFTTTNSGPRSKRNSYLKKNDVCGDTEHTSLSRYEDTEHTSLVNHKQTKREDTGHASIVNRKQSEHEDTGHASIVHRKQSGYEDKDPVLQRNQSGSAYHSRVATNSGRPSIHGRIDWSSK